MKSSKIGIKLLPINRETPKKIEKKKLWTNMPKKSVKKLPSTIVDLKRKFKIFYSLKRLFSISKLDNISYKILHRQRSK